MYWRQIAPVASPHAPLRRVDSFKGSPTRNSPMCGLISPVIGKSDRQKKCDQFCLSSTGLKRITTQNKLIIPMFVGI